MSVEKNIQIAETMRATYEKRSRQICRVFELKVHKQRLNLQQKETLKMMFVEAKWCYNYLLGRMNNEENFDIFSYKGKELLDITHRDKDGNDVSVHLSYITSSLKDSLVARMQSQIKTLSSLKKKGKKVGKLKFKSEYTALGLKQLGTTHKIISSNRIKIQGVKKPLPVNGLKQLSKYGIPDIANAVLVKKCGDYYIYLTVYYDKDTVQKCHKNLELGIDFGCETSLTLSDGRKINAIVEETDRLKSLQRKRDKRVKGSNGRWKLNCKIRKEYLKSTRRKDDLARKIVHELLRDNETIVMQNEQINSWKRKHGRKVQHGILGRVKSELIRHPEQVFVMSRFVPTTKFCYDCGAIHKDISLWDRSFVCPECGVISDRDIHSAECMVWIYDDLRDKIGLGESEFKRADFDEEVSLIFGRWDSQRVKPEDATSLG